MAGNEDDGNMSSLRQFSLEVETTQAKKAHVENLATGYIRQFCFEKLLP